MFSDENRYEAYLLNRHAAPINNWHFLDNTKILMYMIYNNINVFLA